MFRSARSSISNHFFSVCVSGEMAEMAVTNFQFPRKGRMRVSEGEKFWGIFTRCSNKNVSLGFKIIWFCNTKIGIKYQPDKMVCGSKVHYYYVNIDRFGPTLFVHSRYEISRVIRKGTLDCLERFGIIQFHLHSGKRFGSLSEASVDPYIVCVDSNFKGLKA